MNCQIGENLAVHADPCLVEAVDKSAIGQAEFAGAGVDALDPQAAEIALFLAAGDVLILLSSLHGLNGNAEDIFAA